MRTKMSNEHMKVCTLFSDTLCSQNISRKFPGKFIHEYRVNTKTCAHHEAEREEVSTCDMTNFGK